MKIEAHIATSLYTLALLLLPQTKNSKLNLTQRSTQQLSLYVRCARRYINIFSSLLRFFFLQASTAPRTLVIISDVGFIFVRAAS